MLMPYFFLKRNSLIKQLTLNISTLEIDNRYLIQKCQELGGCPRMEHKIFLLSNFLPPLNLYRAY
jgi:hypothetical protein